MQLLLIISRARRQHEHIGAATGIADLSRRSIAPQLVAHIVCFAISHCFYHTLNAHK